MAEQPSHTVIHPGHRLVILGQLFTAGFRFGQIRRYDHLPGGEIALLNPFMSAANIPESIGGQGCITEGPGPVRIRGAEVEKEGVFPVALDKTNTAVCHGHRITLVGIHHLLEMEHLLGCNMVFPDPPRVVTGQLFQVNREGNNMIKGREMVVMVLVAEMSVGMIVQPGEDHRPAGTA